MTDPVESLCRALGYEGSLEKLRRRKRPFYDRLCKLVEDDVMGTSITKQTPVNKIMLIGEKREVTPLIQSPNAYFLERKPNWENLFKNCPSSLDSDEKRVYWCFHNKKLFVRKECGTITPNHKSPPTISSCIIVNEATKEAFYASDYHAISITKAIGPFVNMRRQIKRLDSTFSVSTVRKELLTYFKELDELYTGINKVVKVKKVKKAIKPVVLSQTTTPRPDIVTLYNNLLKCQY